MGASGSTSAQKLVSVLLAFNEERPALTAKDISDATGVPLSSVYRFLAVLRDSNLVEALPEGRYIPGASTVVLGRIARSQLQVNEIFKPIIEQLSKETDETTLLARRSHNVAVCIDRGESSHQVALSFEIGQVMPLTTGAVAKVLLAHAPDSLQEECIEATPWPEKRKNKLRAELTDILELGFAESFSEVDPGIWAVAAPIRTGSGEVLGLSAVGPSYRLDEQRKAQLREATIRSAEELSSRLMSRSMA